MPDLSAAPGGYSLFLGTTIALTANCSRIGLHMLDPNKYDFPPLDESIGKNIIL